MNRRRQLLLRASAHKHTDVSAREFIKLFVFGAHIIIQRNACCRRNEVILGRVNVQQRHGHILQLHGFAAYFQCAFHQFVTLVQVFQKLAETFTGLVRTVVNLFFHAQEVHHLVFVLQRIQHTHVFVHLHHRLQHGKTVVQEITGHSAIGIHEAVDVHVFRPAE